MGDSIDYYFGRENELKNAFEKVFKKLSEDKINEREIFSEMTNGYGYGSFFEGKISVYSIREQACNHLFDKELNLFNLTEDEGHLIREYFHNVSLTQAANDLYLYFSNVLDSEPNRFKGDFDLSKISKKVRLT